ncbi:hypothetical protein MAPG_10068 [Magnaporthiopsis poae ATCC 64411]|uniref:Zn(2)-C6 fungal-type domain-containing protein n=1 Tax=Magnaporthiopsis poae (strain ATCC 64411 / 73-15) TaxID=644358 RepID=A0A0C4EBL6_MAGP6|nr:hypothetical protein MAPG_10068 [Magnaporthiopsis poae ATCC 64411]
MSFNHVYDDSAYIWGSPVLGEWQPLQQWLPAQQQQQPSPAAIDPGLIQGPQLAMPPQEFSSWADPMPAQESLATGVTPTLFDTEVDSSMAEFSLEFDGGMGEPQSQQQQQVVDFDTEVDPSMAEFFRLEFGEAMGELQPQQQAVDFAREESPSIEAILSLEVDEAMAEQQQEQPQQQGVDFAREESPSIEALLSLEVDEAMAEQQQQQPQPPPPPQQQKQCRPATPPLTPVKSTGTSGKKRKADADECGEPSDQGAAKKKRKVASSGNTCSECRRKKAKCELAPDGSGNCTGCVKTGRKCVRDGQDGRTHTTTAGELAASVLDFKRKALCVLYLVWLARTGRLAGPALGVVRGMLGRIDTLSACHMGRGAGRDQGRGRGARGAYRRRPPPLAPSHWPADRLAELASNSSWHLDSPETYGYYDLVQFSSAMMTRAGMKRFTDCVGVDNLPEWDGFGKFDVWVSVEFSAKDGFKSSK